MRSSYVTLGPLREQAAKPKPTSLNLPKAYALGTAPHTVKVYDRATIKVPQNIYIRNIIQLLLRGGSTQPMLSKPRTESTALKPLPLIRRYG